MWSTAPVSAQVNSNEPSAAEVVEHGGGAVLLVTIVAPPIGDPVASRTTPRTAAAADAAAITHHTARRTPALRTRRQFRPHGPGRPKGDPRPEVDRRRIDRDLPASRDRRKHEDAFRPGKRLADAHAIAAAERKVRELRPAGLGAPAASDRDRNGEDLERTARRGASAIVTSGRWRQAARCSRRAATATSLGARAATPADRGACASASTRRV